MKKQNYKETPIERKERIAMQKAFGTSHSRVVENKKKKTNKYACRGGKKDE